MPIKNISRRDFIASTGTVSLALWLGLSAKGNTHKTSSLISSKKFTPFILVESNGNITLYNPKPEMGQGTYQSIPALIAEEFEVSLDMVTIKNTSGELEFGKSQAAGGSSSVRSSYTSLRKMGAAAKAVFITAASIRWQVTESSCYAQNGQVIHRATQKTATYGELLEEAAQLELPKEPVLKDPKDFKILGKQSHRPDIPMKTSGAAIFGIDVTVPDMVYATVERCPVIGGTLKSFDASAALQVPGVLKVGQVERIVGIYSFIGVAVIANSYWAAMQGRKKLKIVWDNKGFETFNLSDYEQHLRNQAAEAGMVDKNIGSADQVIKASGKSVTAFYETPMIAHHTLEPMVCVAHIREDQVEIWSSTQVPGSITGVGTNHVPKLTGFAPEKVTYHNMFIGGGFGRRLYYDYIVEAVNVAKLIDKPVKVLWSREDTTKQGAWRTMTFSKLDGAIADDGKLQAFSHKVIGPAFHESLEKNFDKTKIDPGMVEGTGDQDYQITNLKTAFVRTDFHIPGAAFRSVTSSTLSFPHECFIDEMAVKAGTDPMQFRLNMLPAVSDTRKILEKLKEVSQWDTPLGQNRGRGIAQWKFFAGHCGQVVEVSYSATQKQITIDRVIAVIDLGEVVNPDNVKNQIEGAIVMAITAAVKPGITFKNGVVVENNFYDNPLMRINEAPNIEVYILADGGKIKGVGEPGVPPLAPALANAIFAATGKRIRKMPFDINAI